MDLAKVIGTVVATCKTPSLKGSILSVIQPLDENLQTIGEPLIATDSSAHRGKNEIVYFVASGDAVPTGSNGEKLPVDAAIVGIVDDITLIKIKNYTKDTPKKEKKKTKEK